MDNILLKDAVSEINLSLIDILYSLVLSAASGYLIKKVYVKYGHSLNNRELFSDIFMLLAVTTAIIITIVKYSLALSLGLVGALSIVRFRAAIKEPEELVYLFLVIGIGLCYGANQYVPGLALTGFSLLVIAVTDKLRNKKTFSQARVSLIQVTASRGNYENWAEQQKEIWPRFFQSIILRDFVMQEESVVATYQFHPHTSESSLAYLNLCLNDKAGLTKLEIISDSIVPE